MIRPPEAGTSTTNTPTAGDTNSNVVNSAEAVISETRQNNDSGTEPIIPNTTPIFADVGGRTVTKVKVTLVYDTVNEGANRFQVLYEGNVIGDSGLVTQPGTLIQQANGSSPSVVVRVVESTPDSTGNHAFSWRAVVEFTVIEP